MYGSNVNMKSLLRCYSFTRKQKSITFTWSKPFTRFQMLVNHFTQSNRGEALRYTATAQSFFVFNFSFCRVFSFQIAVNLVNSLQFSVSLYLCRSNEESKYFIWLNSKMFGLVKKTLTEIAHLHSSRMVTINKELNEASLIQFGSDIFLWSWYWSPTYRFFCRCVCMSVK